MNEFTRSPKTSVSNSRRESLTGSIGAPSITGINDDFSTARFALCSKQSSQESRRYSNPTSNSFSSGFRSRSPSDPQNYSEFVPRRFSQPASPAGHGTQKSLAKQEKESYSSLNHLPEVRTYLQFMEKDSSFPHRSNSFSGRNSSRRSSFNRRRRSRSRPRTPMNCYGDEQDSAFNQAINYGPTYTYGQFLTPRSLSNSDSNRFQYDFENDQGNEADVEDDPPSKFPHDEILEIPKSVLPPLRPPSTSTPPHIMEFHSQYLDHEFEEQLSPIPQNLNQRRRSSSIKTTFL